MLNHLPLPPSGCRRVFKARVGSRSFRTLYGDGRRGTVERLSRDVAGDRRAHPRSGTPTGAITLQRKLAGKRVQARET